MDHMDEIPCCSTSEEVSFFHFSLLFAYSNKDREEPYRKRNHGIGTAGTFTLHAIRKGRGTTATIGGEDYFATLTESIAAAKSEHNSGTVTGRTASRAKGSRYESIHRESRIE